ncbi:hypothetical protein EDM22_12285 [Agromyces tardus]|uniref:Uncharacterized protein n=1 Tax=Agromyces tardus TaxID=2583849 RepID=A0A3M8A8G8_9MICO|nr:hypothetical protein [Agromyces tardus]RNB47402.1 hypothetical protein EDM22_12285 [Agromyces tardus]
MTGQRDAPATPGRGEIETNYQEGTTMETIIAGYEVDELSNSPELREWCARVRQAHKDVGPIPQDDPRAEQVFERYPNAFKSLRGWSRRALQDSYFTVFVGPTLDVPPVPAPAWAASVEHDWRHRSVLVAFMSDVVDGTQVRQEFVVDARTAEVRRFPPKFRYEGGHGWCELGFAATRLEELSAAVPQARQLLAVGGA